MNRQILLIEDEETFVDSFKLMLRDHHFDVIWSPTGRTGINQFRASPNAFAVVVIDYQLPDLTGSEVCQHLRTINQDQEFLIATGHQKVDYLTDILDVRANGFLLKGQPVSEMREQVLLAIARFETKTRIVGRDPYSPTELENKLRSFGIVGRSTQLGTVLGRIENYTRSPYPTLIVGETGVGKELVANALVPKGKKLITVNCASFRDKENLLESELFGHVKGAFTGADKETTGLVMQAHENVLFLDELHQLSISAQAKLLRFLQEMRFRKVGDGMGREISVAFKLISAVQPDIKERINDGRFLPDLAQRVKELVIQVPPLRTRPEDIEPLVRRFQDEFNSDKHVQAQKQFRISTIHEMSKLRWDGNVRALKGAVRQMLTDCTSDVVETKHLKAYIKNDILISSTENFEQESISEATSKLEAKIILETLSLSRTRAEAAKRLGLKITTFARRLKDLEIAPELHLRA
jgi:DNA-binding NtrC family response regulator